MNVTNSKLVRPFAIFTGYMLMVITASIHVVRKLRQTYLSLTSSSRSDEIASKISARIITFSVLAAISLSVTWYFMFQFFAHSYDNWLSARTNNTIVKKLVSIALPNSSLKRIGAWLKDTSLFEEAWAGAASTNARYWWTQQIFFFTAGWAGFLFAQGSRRNIPNIWVYMFIGQFVAISFAMNLFFVAVVISEGHDALGNPKQITELDQSTDGSTTVNRSKQQASTIVTIVALSASLLLVIFLPEYLGSSWFMPILATIHLVVFIPTILLYRTNSRPPFKPATTQDVIGLDFLDVYLLVFATAFLLVIRASITVNHPRLTHVHTLWDALKSHPAVSSVGSDAILCWLSVTAWICTRSR